MYHRLTLPLPRCGGILPSSKPLFRSVFLSAPRRLLEASLVEMHQREEPAGYQSTMAQVRAGDELSKNEVIVEEGG
jgi:hypothetical protein